eukprot:5371636-Karenia_brevis.AAC.1
MKCNRVPECSASTLPSQHARGVDSGGVCAVTQGNATKYRMLGSTQPSQHARKVDSGSVWRRCS